MQLARDIGNQPDNFLHADRPGPGASDIHYARSGEETSGDLHFTHLVGTLRRHRRLIIAVAAIGTVLAGTVGLLIPRKYTATAEIVVDPQQADAAIGVATANQAPGEAAIDTQVAMLTSREFLRRVFDSLSAGQGTPVTGANAIRHTGEKARADTAREIDKLQRWLKVMQVRRSRVISISFTSTSPETAAAIANRIADLHIASTIDQKRTQTHQELVQLAARASKLKAEMQGGAEELRQALEHPSAAANGSRLAELKSEAAGAGQAYAGVLRRQTELREQEESITPEAHILSRAETPDRPSSPNPLLFIFPALIASSILGCLLAVFRDRLDRGLRSERDVVETLGIPCLGLVPRLSDVGSIHPHKRFLSEPFAPYSEAIRSSAAALKLAGPGVQKRTLLICSSVPGEGKTTLAVSLAVYAAHLGRRTLLVDFDFRHPSALRLLHADDENDSRALDLEGGPAPDLVRHLADLDIDYLPIPRCQGDPLALFAGTHLRDFLRQLRDRYDCIFIDSPPLLSVTEARLLRALADKILFIVKWGSTRPEVAQNALNLLRTAVSGRRPVAKTSAIITQVDMEQHANYGYGDAVEASVKYKKYYFHAASI